MKFNQDDKKIGGHLNLGNKICMDCKSTQIY